MPFMYTIYQVSFWTNILLLICMNLFNTSIEKRFEFD